MKTLNFLCGFLIVICAAICLQAQAETLDELLARIIIDNTVVSHGEPAQVGGASPMTDATGARDTSDWILPTTVTTRRGQSRSELVLLVYDKGQADEEAYITAGDHNYIPVPTNAELLDHGEAVLQAMIAAAVPVPAVPGETALGYLKLRCSEAAWVGRTIANYKKAVVRERDGHAGIYLYVYLNKEGGGTDTEKAWIRYNSKGEFVVAAWDL
jgi:hypothetical protein